MIDGVSRAHRKRSGREDFRSRERGGDCKKSAAPGHQGRWPAYELTDFGVAEDPTETICTRGAHKLPATQVVKHFTSLLIDIDNVKTQVFPYVVRNSVFQREKRRNGVRVSTHSGGRGPVFEFFRQVCQSHVSAASQSCPDFVSQ
ncbi:hypothetical protein GCM10027082_13760 [Comamonas humi]